MTNKPKITAEQLQDKQKEFLRDNFKGRCSDISPKECVQAAWRDVFRQLANMRNPFFAKEAPEASREVLRCFTKSKIMEIAEKIHKPSDFACDVKSKAADMLAERGVSVTHVGHVRELCEAVTKEHGGRIASGRLTLGRAQKLLSMYLKYMWCTGNMPEVPPYCPFDDIIINQVGLPGEDDPLWQELGGLAELEQQHENIWTWTRSDTEENYLIWLVAADEAKRQRGRYNSLSEWELFVFPNGDGE